MAVGDIISQSRYNELQGKISALLGVGSGDKGYNNTVSSNPVAEGNEVLVSDMNNLYTDFEKVYIHINNTAPVTINTVTTSLEIEDSLYNAYEILIVELENDRFVLNGNQADIESGGVNSVRDGATSPWGGTSQPQSVNHTIKISFSSQEWCGNTFVQLNNRAQFEIDFRSYFETNADKKIVLKKNILENDLWNLLRINPKKLPTGNFNSIPSFEFLALNHQKIAAYQANASLKEEGDFITYSIYYPSLKRELIIKATKEFPFTIESWKETFTKNGKENTSEATKIKTIQTAYWNKKRVTDTKERTLLGL